jgi:CBS domain-containing protein
MVFLGERVASPVESLALAGRNKLVISKTQWKSGLCVGSTRTESGPLKERNFMEIGTALSDSKIHFAEPICSVLDKKDRAVWSVSPESTVYEAIERMAENHVGALVVLAAEKLVGIISERDYARKVILKGRQSRETQVHEIMSTEVHCVNLETSIDECMRVMTLRVVRHLPVVVDEQVVGMISLGDLVNWIVNSHEQTIHQLESYIGGTYPG